MIFGREHELTALHAAYADMLAGHGSVLFLTGEAGLGKTTLVHAWAKERGTQSASAQRSADCDARRSADRDTQPTTLFLESACSIPIGNVDVGRLEALQPWADVVAQLHEKMSTQRDSQGTSQHKINLGKLMRDSAPAWLWALPFVGEVAHAALVTARLAKDQRTGTTSPVHSPTGPDPSIDERQFAASNQEQVFQQYVNLLTKISGSTPLVLFLDDLHWADTSSCNLLFYLARQIAGKQILVIATYRQDDAVRAEDGKGHAILTVKNEILRYSTGKELALSYLSRDAIRGFLSNTFTSVSDDGRISTYVADEKFEQWLHKISDGNSLFMTQFVKTLREDGHLDGNGEFVGDYASAIIPTSALAVVEERTRRLDVDTRKLLMYATAEGEEFTTYVLERLTKKEPMELLDELHTATTMGLISQRGTGRLYANTTTGIFGFSHALFHKALYDGLLDMQKQHLHQQCFQLLKAEWDRLSDTKQRSTTLATKLLAHATKCEEWQTVADVALAAAQEFWKAYNEGEALAMITQVLEASDVADGLVAERAEALFLRGEIGFLRGRHKEAVDDFRAAEALFRFAAIPHRAVDSVNGVARTLIGSIDNVALDVSMTESTRALAEAGALGYRQGEANALSNIGIVHSHRRAFDESLEYCARSLSICIEMGDRRGEAGALNNIGMAHNDRGDNDEALAYYARSLVISTDIGDRRGEGSVLHNMGSVYYDRGSFDEALSLLKRSLALFAAIGNRQYEANSLDGIGNALTGLGEYDEALSYLERSFAIRTAVGDSLGEAGIMHNMGWTLRLSGKISEARDYLERSLVVASAISQPVVVAYNTAELGLVNEAESETLVGAERDVKRAEARRLVEEALAVFRKFNRPQEIAKWEKELERLKP